MDAKIYKFDHRQGLLDMKYYYVRDYFQYYTTGVEDIIPNNPSLFNYATRENAERAENIMYEKYGDANLADVFLAVNNQNLLWATPFDLDAFQDAIEFRMNYLEYLMKDRIVSFYNPEGKREWNDVGQICYDRVTDDIHNEDDLARTVVVPASESIQDAVRKIEDFFKARRVR